jgi:hypothetical protein
MHSKSLALIGSLILVSCGESDNPASGGSGKKHLNGEYVSEYMFAGLKITNTKIFGPSETEALIVIKDGIADMHGRVCERVMYDGHHEIVGDTLVYTEMRVFKQMDCSMGWKPTYGIPEKFKHKIENITDTSFDLHVDGAVLRHTLVQ